MGFNSTSNITDNIQLFLQERLSVPRILSQDFTKEAIVNTPNETGIFAKTWFQVLGIYLLAQAFIGVIAIEFAWHRTKRFREKNEERDS